MFTEAHARQAGQVAAISAICEYADMLTDRQAGAMLRRSDRIQRTRRAEALRSGVC